MNRSARLRAYAWSALLVYVTLYVADWLMPRRGPLRPDMLWAIIALIVGAIVVFWIEQRVRGELETFGDAARRHDRKLEGAIRDLRTERDLAAGILETMQEGVMVVRADGRVRLVNAALREILLLSADVVDRSVLVVARHAPLIELFETVRRKRAPASAEMDVGDMKPRRLLVRVSHLPSEEGALLAVFVDVTDLRRLESMRRDFVANVSHELRTPVTAVRSAAETLMGGAIGDAATATRFVGMIERNAERLASLIDDLLELSRIESREFRLRRDSTDIAAVVQQVLTTTRDRAERAGVTLLGEVDERTKGFVTDRRALEQVLGNLVDNAVKYCPNSRVVVRAESTDTGGVKLEVADDGPGIESRHLPRIFERFYRVDAGRSREVGGTGLGLSIVKHLVEALAGKVAVTSTIGKGTTFTITLPSREISTPTLPLDSTDDLQQSL